MFDQQYQEYPTVTFYASNPFNDAFKVDHSKTTELAYTDISVSGVSSMYKHGKENRPKNMGVIWIIRVW